VVATERHFREENVGPLLNRIRELAANQAEAIIFDCSELRYINSFGLSVFLRARKLMREAHGDPPKPDPTAGASGDPAAPLNASARTRTGAGSADPTRVRLVHASPHVMDVLRTAHLTQILPVFDDLDAARAAH